MSEDNKYTSGLAKYIAGARYEDIPQSVVDKVKLLVLDSAGAGLLGSALPWSQAMRAAVADYEQPGDVSIWGTNLKYSAVTAALINGTAVHGFEIDDIGAGGHNGSVTMTSALALAQHYGRLSGEDLINAIVVGVEVASRVGECTGGIPHVGMGFHGPGLQGTFASVASSAVALRLNHEQAVDAICHAGQQAASLMFTHHGGMGKRMLAGQAARAGTFGAILAKNGFTNAGNVFEADYGSFPAAHTGNQKPPVYDLTKLTKGLGTEYQSEGIGFKMYACRIPNHSTLEAIKAMRRKRDFKAEEVQSVEIRLDRGAFLAVGWPWVPTTIASAQLNIHYVSALMILENDVLMEQFTDEKVQSPVTAAMIARIKVIHDEELDRGRGFARETPVKVTLKDGTVLEERGRLRGTRENPVSRDELVGKFRRMVKPHLSRAQQDRMIELCDRLETVEDANALVKLMELSRK